MTREQINLLSMLKSILQFFDENPQLLEGKPALQAAVEKLRAYVSEIDALEQAQAIGSKADTALKRETKTSIISALLKVLAGIGAHGAAINDTRLKMAADVSEYELKKMRDNYLIIQTNATHELAMSIATALETWHVTQADIDALNTNSAEFEAKDPAIKNIKARSAKATADIKAKLDEAYNFTKDTIDAMMLPYKTVNPTAYGHYQKAREIIHLAGGHKKGTAPDNGTKGK